MSYGSAYIQTEPVSRINARATRPRKEHVKRLVQYEKEFDVNLSRLDARERSVKDSMIAYSEKMRSITEARNTFNSGHSKHDPLFVRAKHIPKHPTRGPRKRRPMSFDELLGRDRDQTKQTTSKQRPHSDKQLPLKEITSARNQSDEMHLPVLSERLRKASPSVQVSFVSASDLYDIVDFSLRNRGSRQDSLNAFEMEKGSRIHGADGIPPGSRLHGADGHHPGRRNDKMFDKFIAEAMYDQFERCERKGVTMTSTDQYRHTSDYANISHPAASDSKEIRVPTAQNFEEKTSSVQITHNPKNKNPKLPLLYIDPLRYRPPRVKRMKLQKPDLGIIPEDYTVSQGTLNRGIPQTNKAPVSPPPHRLSPRSLVTDSNLEFIHEDEANQDDNIQDSLNDLPVTDGQKSTRRIVMRDDGDVRIEVTQCPPKHESTVSNSNTKLRAQKKFKKLIFLRDMK